MESTPLDMTCQCRMGCPCMKVTRAMLVRVCDCAMRYVCNLSNWLKKLLVPTISFVRLQNMVAARQVDAVRRRFRAKVPRSGFESYMLPDSTPPTWVQDRCAPLASFPQRHTQPHERKV